MPRIPHAGVRLVRRSRALTLGEKAVWQELAEFPDTGCWLSAAALGDRLDLAGEVVERARRTLLQCGLAKHGIRQPSEGRRGRPAPTWFAVLPDEFVPPSRTPTDADLARLAEPFDAHLRTALVRPETRPSSRVKAADRPTAQSGNAREVARSVSRGEGGRGEGSPLSEAVGTTATPFSPRPSTDDLSSPREAASVQASVRPPFARTLAGGGTAELVRPNESTPGARLAPRDLRDQLSGWLDRLSPGSSA